MDSNAIAYGYAIGYNDGLGQGGGDPGQYLSDMGTLKAVIDDGAANLSIVLTDNGDNDSGEPILSEYQYTYSAKMISESVTTSATVGDVTTTNTKSFSKYIIDKLYNAKGKCIMQAVYSDESKGVVSHYLDEDGNKIYIDGGYLNE